MMWSVVVEFKLDVGLLRKSKDGFMRILWLIDICFCFFFDMFWKNGLLMIVFMYLYNVIIGIINLLEID